MVVSAEGHPVQMLDIVLSVWGDGGYQKITYRMEPEKEYEIIVVNRQDNMLYNIKGIYQGFGIYNPYAPPCYADYIKLDCSKTTKAKLVQFDIKDIRAIKEIQTL